MSQKNRRSDSDPGAPPSRAARPAANVRRLRTARGLTISQLAALAEIDEQTLREIEEGALSPSIKPLWSLANALSVPFSSLLHDGGSGSESEARSGTQHALVRLHAIGVSERRGSVARRSLLPSDQQGGGGTEVHELKLAPKSEEHAALYPRGARETVLVTAGQAVVFVDGEQTVLQTGQSIELDAHTPRAYSNPHALPAVLYIMVAPPGPR